MVLAIDFDGTIVEHKYPAIGKERTFAFDTLKALQKDGHILILWTIRTGKQLDDAVQYCKKNGIEFYSINSNFPEEELDDAVSRKINADVFIDDRNVGGFLGWGAIWQALKKDASDDERNAYWEAYKKAERKTLCGFMKAIFCR